MDNIKRVNFRTDMADERVDEYKKINNLSAIDGIKVESFEDELINTTIVDVLNQNGERAVSKKIGRYITLQVKELNYMEDDEKERVSNIISDKLKDMIGEDTRKSILVVGLGNEYVTPDALGPKVASNIETTRHLLNYARDLISDQTREVSSISPGVLGKTGIETSEMVAAISKKIRADMLIVIDSLASQSIDRVGNTIQISNTGITPGAGVRNKREGINEETLGIPVIAIGVPTVVDMATITNDALEKVLKIDKNSIGLNVDNISTEARYDVISKILDAQNYIVTPKEVDELIETMAHIITEGINLSI